MFARILCSGWLLVAGLLLPASAQEAFHFRETFDDFDPARFRTRIPNKNITVREGALWTHG